MKYIKEYFKTFLMLSGWIGGVILLASLFLGSPPIFIIYVGCYGVFTGSIAGLIKVLLEE